MIGAVLVTVAGCAQSAAPTLPTSTGKAELSTPAGKPLRISPDRMLVATGGITPTAFGKPAHGKIAYDADGAVVYTPDAGFTGTDELSVTVSRAVKSYAEDQLPLATIGGVVIKASAHGSAIAAVPGSSDEIYGLTDRGPNVNGRAPNEKVLPVPDYHPQDRQAQTRQRHRDRGANHHVAGTGRLPAGRADRPARQHRRVAG